MAERSVKHPPKIDKELALKAFRLMSIQKAMAEKYEANAKLTSKYVHATARGHEAVQIAMGLQMTPESAP